MAVALATAALAGCGDDDSTSGTGDGGGGPTYPTPDPGPVADEGCTPDHPSRLLNNGLEGYFRACATEGLDSVVVINTSSTALTVSAANGYSAPQLTTDALQASSSFREEVVRLSVQGQCNVASAGGPCRVPPNGRLFARGQAPVAVRVDIDPVQTAVATGAGATAGYVQSRLTPRPLRFRDGAVECARSVQNYVRPDVYPETAVRQAFEFADACSGLIQQIDAELRKPPTPAADDATRALKAAGRYTKNLRRDFYVLSAVRIAARIR